MSTLPLVSRTGLTSVRRVNARSALWMNTIWPRNPSVDGGLAALVFDVRFQNFESGSADRAEEEAARPEGARMFAVVDWAEAIQHSRSVLAFERPNQAAKYYGGDTGAASSSLHSTI